VGISNPIALCQKSNLEVEGEIVNDLFREMIIGR
jgi:hypothetical protein